MAEFVFHHGGVSVPSLEEATAWYSSVLGFEIESTFYIDQARSHAAMLRRGNLRMELFEVEGAMALPPERREVLLDIRTHGNKHVAFAISDLDAFLAEMRQKQVDVALVIKEAFGSGCYIRDCAGNLIEFVEQPRI